MKNKFYTRDVKLKAVQMRLSEVPVKEIVKALNIKSEYKYIFGIIGIEMESFIALINQLESNILMVMVPRKYKVQVIKIE